MINFKNETQNQIWWIVKSIDDTVVHYGMLEQNQLIESGQETIELFNNEIDWLNQLTNLGITYN